MTDAGGILLLYDECNVTKPTNNCIIKFISIHRMLYKLSIDIDVYVCTSAFLRKRRIHNP